MPGPYIINDITLLVTLIGQRAVVPESDAGYGVQCVGLLKAYSNCPPTKEWVKGPFVKDGGTILQRGTAVGTFIGGVYPSHAHGNHACFFIEFLKDGTGFTVLEQHVWPVVDRIQTRNVLYVTSSKDLASNGSIYSVIL